MEGSSQTQKKYGEFYSKTERHTRNKVPYCQILVSDKTQKSAYLLGSTADFKRLSLLFSTLGMSFI